MIKPRHEEVIACLELSRASARCAGSVWSYCCQR
jgi:hypothetical protein